VSNKIKKTAFALVAAAVVAGSASMAQAQQALDGTTGLRTEYYYAPIGDLARQGAPISARARQYLSEHPARSAGRVELPSGYDARAQAPVLPFGPGLNNGASASWGSRQGNFDASGAPVGPYF
jgi:hypothetical protein